MQSLTQQFLTFCRSKPADEAYDPLTPKICALTQFAEVHGFEHLRGVGLIPEPFVSPILDGDYTWGALATRLDALGDRS